jgi:ribosomal protein S27E
MAWPLLAAIVGALLGLKRTCSKCGRNQLVASEQKHLVVKCKFCGADIPPRGR